MEIDVPVGRSRRRGRDLLLADRQTRKFVTTGRSVVDPSAVALQDTYPPKEGCTLFAPQVFKPTIFIMVAKFA